MRVEDFDRLTELFERARTLDAEARDAFVAAETVKRPALRAELERLLALHEAEDGTLDGFGAAARGLLQDLAEGDAPRFVGPYRILRELGAGGMGIVYLAEQEEPLKRLVALKIIRPGMDSREIVARFELERQAVARMGHPGIAQIYDAGTTPDGRPYFALEYVDGEPLTDWCDARRLDTSERISLFRQVCAAVEHAHQRGIIHRDLKPSNVLVTEVDGEPIPKVIDFGIARAVDEHGSGRTLLTELGRMIGTPAYMSPEQAATGSMDLDTRTDIYSLGVLLYQLLVGMTPFDPEDLRRAGYVEMQRILTEEEPQRPSARAEALGRTSTTHAESRRLDPESLVRNLRGDLDWITMKALEHDRSRRYASAGAFAQDLERYLANEPVEARPPNQAYRVSKFVRRHRGPVVAASLLLLMLVAGLLVSTALYVQAQEARTLAERRLATVQRHADMQISTELEQAAEALWPMLPERGADLEAWLDRADDLLARLPEHRDRRDALRARGRRRSHAEDDLHARAIEDLMRERRGKVRELGRYKPATRLPLEIGETGLPLTTYLRHEFELVEVPRAGLCTYRLHCFDGAVLYLNGEELGRWNLPEGRIGPDTPASGVQPPETLRGSFPAEALRPGRNVLAAEIHVQSPERARIQLTFDAVDTAGNALVDVDAVWSFATHAPDGWTGLSAGLQWPQGPMPIGFTRQTELPERFRLGAEHLEGEIARLDRELTPLRVERMRREEWAFESGSDQEEHDELAALVAHLEALGRTDPPGLATEIQERLREATTIRARTVDAYGARWSRAAAEIAAAPGYGGMHLEPQVGLVPLGADPRSGLQEFGHPTTGSLPTRDGEGRLVLSDDVGLVFVLVPGGSFRMGSIRPGPGNEPDAPNVDPLARRSEYPIHDVTLAPYLLSKYEMTQGQWLRLTGRNPSTWPVGSSAGPHVVGLQNPVESMAWHDARQGLGRLGLRPPDGGPVGVRGPGRYGHAVVDRSGRVRAPGLPQHRGRVRRPQPRGLGREGVARPGRHLRHPRPPGHVRRQSLGLPRAARQRAGVVPRCLRELPGARPARGRTPPGALRSGAHRHAGRVLQLAPDREPGRVPRQHQGAACGDVGRRAACASPRSLATRRILCSRRTTMAYCDGIRSNRAQGRLEALIAERAQPDADKEWIDRRIWDLFGERWAVMFTDLSGFSRHVAEFGIVHFLQVIYESQRLLVPVIEEYDGILLKREGDSLLVMFRNPAKAVACSLAMQGVLERYNQGREPSEQVLLCVGLGYGDVLRIGDEDIFGAEVNAASKLGEDEAGAGDILVTDSLRDAVRAVEGVHLEPIAFVPPGAAGAFRVVYGDNRAPE